MKVTACGLLVAKERCAGFFLKARALVGYYKIPFFEPKILLKLHFLHLLGFNKSNPPFVNVGHPKSHVAPTCMKGGVSSWVIF